ncbi:hypothetical protein B0H16DRAFT_1807645 [Mycena metata]|uniref:Uncharacterized protein n=1 Tax=Mycena metata TaxID=1033252 RepID=A0AAD7H9A9_9AGAR|nr:hypothetical protein B0H16DRAFT_1807645 [Mycena metata]
MDATGGENRDDAECEREDGSVRHGGRWDGKGSGRERRARTRLACAIKGRMKVNDGCYMVIRRGVGRAPNANAHAETSAKKAGRKNARRRQRWEGKHERRVRKRRTLREKKKRNGVGRETTRTGITVGRLSSKGGSASARLHSATRQLPAWAWNLKLASVPTLVALVREKIGQYIEERLAGGGGKRTI